MELYHHGILGQHWGIRRYQNADGSLTNAGKKRYDYKKGEEYKNSSPSSKKKRDEQYEKNARLFGKKDANRIEYVRDTEGSIKANKEETKVFVKQSVLGVTAAIAITAIPYLASTAVAKGKEYLSENNLLVTYYGEKEGIPYVGEKKGFSLGIKEMIRGKKVLDAVMSARKG